MTKLRITPLTAESSPPPSIEDSPNFDPAAQQRWDDMKRRQRGATATIAADIASAPTGLPALAGILGGTIYDTARAAVMPNDDVQPLADATARMQQSDLLQMSMDARQWAYDLFETDEFKRDVTADHGEEGYIPLDEEMWGTAMGALIPLPSMRLNAAIKGTGLASKAARGAVTATEALLPGFTGGIGNAATNVAVGVGTTEAFRHVLDEPTLLGAVQGTNAVTETLAMNAQAGVDVGGVPLPPYSDQFRVTPISGDSVTRLRVSPLDESEPAGDPNLAGKALLTGAATGVGIAALAGGIRRGARAAGRGGDALRTVGDAASRIEEGLSDTNKALKDGAAQVADDTRAYEFDAFTKRATYSGGDNLRQQAETLGEFGDMVSPDGKNYSRVRSRVPLFSYVQAYNAADPLTRQHVDAALDAAGRLQEYEAFKHAMTTAQQQKWHAKVKELKNVYDSAMRNPEVRKLVEANRIMYDGYQEYRYRSGTINTAQARREIGRAQKYPYQPAQRDLDASKPFNERMFDAVGNSLWNDTAGGRIGNPHELRRFKDGAKSIDDTEIARIFTEKRLQSVEAARIYSRRTIAFGLENQTRRDYIDLRAKEGKLQKARPDQKDRVIEVWRNGDLERWHVPDTREYNALKFHPHRVIPVMNTMRKWLQASVTGNLNPVFAPVSLLYNASMGMLTGNVQRGYSGALDALIDRAAKQLGIGDNARTALRGSVAGVVRPVELPHTVMMGIVEGIRGRLSEIAAQRARKLLSTDPTNTKLQSAVKQATDDFLETAYGKMVSNGYHGSRFEADPFDASNAMGALRTIQEKLYDNTLYRGYDGALNTVREAYQLGVFSRNIAAMMADPKNKGKRSISDLPVEDVNRMVAYAKDIAVDTSIAGSSPFVNAMTSMFPYSNVALRTFVSLMRSMTNPATASMLTTTVAFAAYNIMRIREELGQDVLNEWMARTSEWDQQASFPMLIGEEIVNVPLGIELGALTYTTLDLMREMFDDKSQQEEYLARSLSGNLATNLGRLLGLSTPPAIDVASVLINGARYRLGRGLTGQEALDPALRTSTDERRYYGANDNDGLMTDAVADIIDAMFPGFGTAMADAIEVGLEYETGINYDKPWHEAVDRIYRVAERFDERHLSGQVKQRFGGLPKLWGGEPADRRTSTFTPQSQRVFQVDAFMRRVKDEYDQMRNLGLGRGSSKYAIGPMLHEMATMPVQIVGEDLREQLTIMGSYYNTRERIKADMLLTDLRKELEALNAGSPNIPRDEYIEVYNGINKQMQDAYEHIVREFGTMEQGMKRRFGDDWTIEKLVDELGKRINRELPQQQ